MACAATASAQTAALDPASVQGTLVGSYVPISPYSTWASYYVQPNTSYTGVANLWMRGNSPNNAVASGCTGSLLWTGWHILTAAHCLTSGGVVNSPYGTARFRTTSGGWQDYSWSSVTIKSGYSGNVIEEQDVAIITLDQQADNAFARYALHSGSVLNQKVRIGGYGRFGDGNTGDLYNSVSGGTQFNDGAQLRQGYNVFESTCNDAGFCANQFNSSPGTYGGVLLLDMDVSGASSAGFMCTTLGFCGVGYGMYEEAAVGRGDSGSGAFTVGGNRIMGVSSFGSTGRYTLGGTTYTVLSQFGGYNGFACVADGTGNAACQANYDFVVNTVTPEPSTYLLMATGLFLVVMVARRRGGLV